MIAALCCVLVIAQAAQPNEAYLARTERALAADAKFLPLHRGFVAYLQAHPETLAAERAWWDVAVEPTMGAAFARFDEALLGDAEASTALDAAYDLLARDPALREHVDALQRVEFTQPSAQALVSAGLRSLRANPDAALRGLRSLDVPTQTQSDLRDFFAYLQRQPALGEELGRLFGAVDESPLAQTRLFPWWAQLARGEGAGAAYGAMGQQFLEAPRRFWAWHHRELAWAEDAQARDWARYLYRRARRLPEVGEGYTHYLRALFAEPARVEAAERSFARDRRDAAPGFPPKAAPPVLPPLVAVTAPAGAKPEETAAERAREMAEKAQPKVTPRVPVEGVKPARPAMPVIPRVEMRKAAPRPRE